VVQHAPRTSTPSDIARHTSFEPCKPSTIFNTSPASVKDSQHTMHAMQRAPPTIAIKVQHHEAPVHLAELRLGQVAGQDDLLQALANKHAVDERALADQLQLRPAGQIGSVSGSGLSSASLSDWIISPGDSLQARCKCSISAAISQLGRRSLSSGNPYRRSTV
jgi:hypothetical protein